jgi:hypothetical protein
MRLRCRFSLALLAFLFALPPLAARAEELWSDEGYFLDIPEGFSLADGDGANRFAFLSPDSAMEFDLLRYDRARFPKVETLAAETLKKLASSGGSETFVYEGRQAVLAELDFKLGNAPKKGYALFIEGRPAPQAAPGTAPASGPAAPQSGSTSALPAPTAERHTALLAYTDADKFPAYADLVLSALDSFSADKVAKRRPGPMSQYLFSFPPKRTEKKNLDFGETRLELPWNSDEAKEEEDLAGREFRVLQAYAQNESLWRPAWARAYRMIYRESAASLDELASRIDPLLPDDPTEAARSLLSWVQGFHYERDQQGSDFVAPLDSAYEGRGDCDSRAMVMAIILERRGVETVLMVSRDYSHALLGLDVPGGGQRFPFEGKQYLVAETTAKVGLGMIAADQADWSKWMGIRLGN